VWLRAAHHATSSRCLARAVLPRDKTQVAGDLTGALEPTGVVERRDKRTRGDRTDARQRRQSFDHGIRPDESGELRIGTRELGIEGFR
jgi:hypothetical protein